MDPSPPAPILITGAHRRGSGICVGPKTPGSEQAGPGRPDPAGRNQPKLDPFGPDQFTGPRASVSQARNSERRLADLDPRSVSMATEIRASADRNSRMVKQRRLIGRRDNTGRVATRRTRRGRPRSALRRQLPRPDSSIAHPRTPGALLTAAVQSHRPAISNSPHRPGHPLRLREIPDGLGARHTDGHPSIRPGKLAQDHVRLRTSPARPGPAARSTGHKPATPATYIAGKTKIVLRPRFGHSIDTLEERGPAPHRLRDRSGPNSAAPPRTALLRPLPRRYAAHHRHYDSEARTAGRGRRKGLELTKNKKPGQAPCGCVPPGGHRAEGRRPHGPTTRKGRRW